MSAIAPWFKRNIWPIENYELKKFIPMLLMSLFITFNYTILRNMKDSLIVNAPGSGAEALPFLKLFCVTPAAILFTMIYMKLSTKLNKEQLFVATIAPFLAFFALFALVLYPNIDLIHPTALAEYLRSIAPKGLHGIIAIMQNWSYAVFYVLAELWGSLILSVLFWSFANDITKVGESKRFYGLFNLGANVGLMLCGPYIVFVTDLRAHLPAGADEWGLTINVMMGTLFLSGLIIVALHKWLNAKVMTDPRFFNPNEVKKQKKSKLKMGVWDSIKYIGHSKYIGLIAVLVLSYGVSINLIEVTWKNYVKELYPNENDYFSFMGRFSFFTGLATTIMILFVSSNIIRRFGWGLAAILTPVMLLITGVLFFTGVLTKDLLSGVVTATLGVTPLFLTVMVGAVQNILSKSTKYSLFDPTKEMAYIPLDEELKVKGKAAVDGIGGRLGKSGGAFINSFLIATMGSVASIAPFVFAAMVVMLVGWIYAVKALNKRYVVLVAEKEKSDAAAAAQSAQEEIRDVNAEAVKTEATLVSPLKQNLESPNA